MRYKKCVALFDFDGTITTKDSLSDFIQFAIGKYLYYFGLFLLSPMLMAYIFRFLSNNKAKEKLIEYFFKDWDISKFQYLANKYSLEKISVIIRPKAVEKIKWHQQQGHKVIVVSASMECWLKKWSQKNSVELIATKLEIKNNKITGKFLSKNCYGPEKVNRIKELYDLSQYDYIYAYGDSRGDKEMLTLADESFYKPFQN